MDKSSTFRKRIFMMMILTIGILVAVGAAYAAIRSIQLNSAVAFPVDI